MQRGPRGRSRCRSGLRAAGHPGVNLCKVVPELSTYVWGTCTSMWGSLLAQWRAEARVLKAPRETNLGRLWYGTVRCFLLARE